MKKLLRAAAIISAFALTSPAVTAGSARAEACSAECFVLRETDGKIALYSEDSPEPLAVYGTPLSALYPVDMELLRAGIRLKTRAEVTRLIEDLGIE